MKQLRKLCRMRLLAIKKSRRRQKKGGTLHWLNTFSVGFAVMLLGGYLTYLSMPNISIKMAAVQSGIDAKYPGYKPDGYALNGPIKFKSGEVSMKYAYADGSSGYTITQQKAAGIRQQWKNFSLKNTRIQTPRWSTDWQFTAAERSGLGERRDFISNQRRRKPLKQPNWKNCH